MLMLRVGDVFGYVLGIGLLVTAWFVIRHFTASVPDEKGKLSVKTARYLTWGLYALAAVLVLSALGVCPGGEQVGLDPLLNRPVPK
jgi:hypothetical protein